MAKNEAVISASQYNYMKERALKAEKAYLSLRKDTSLSRLKNDLTVAEDEYRRKLSLPLYSAVPEHIKRIDEDFKNESTLLLKRIDEVEKVYKLCIDGLDWGLSLDDLPLTTESSVDVEKILADKLMALKAYNYEPAALGNNYTMLNNGLSVPTFGEIGGGLNSMDSFTDYAGEKSSYLPSISGTSEVRDWRNEKPTPVERNLFTDSEMLNSSFGDSSVTSLWGRQSPSVIQNGTATPGMLPSTLYGDLGSAAASRTQTPDHASGNSGHLNIKEPSLIDRPVTPSTSTALVVSTSKSMAGKVATPSPTTKLPTAADTKPSAEAATTPVKAANSVTAAAATVKSKSNVKPSGKVDWSNDTFIAILNGLSKKYKQMTSKAIKEKFEKVAQDIGLSDLGGAYKETERRIALVLKPEQRVSAAPTAPTPPLHSSGRIDKTKTVMCMHWSKYGNCFAGDKCTYAHGQAELRTITYQAPPLPANTTTPAVSTRTPMYTSLCKYYSANQKCPHGDSCYYAHGKEELVVKVDSYQHEEPCNDQRCTGRIKYLLQKTSMCPRFPLNLCSYGSNCWFAHSEAELKPMPKNEICMDHKKGQCMHADAPEKCVYAHGEHELRKKPSSPSDDIDRCVVCKRTLTYKKSLLTCKHDNFHESCLKERMKKGIVTCPVCNKQTRL